MELAKHATHAALEMENTRRSGATESTNVFLSSVYSPLLYANVVPEKSAKSTIEAQIE